MASQLTPQEFVRKWRASTLTESAAYVSHFNDLCSLVGHDTPADVDQHGTTFTFQAGVTKQSGKQGWADVWKKGFFAVEYKGPHGDLDKAYQQLLQYREALQNPPLLIVSDIQQLVIHTNFTNTVKQVSTITLDDLLTPAGLKRLRDVFYNPDAFRAPQTTEQVTKDAAKEFARLADLLRKYGEDPQRIAHFLIRLLFCLFAEDIGLLPNGLFSRLINTTRKRAPLFAEQLRQLFATMAKGGFFAMEDIPHFNGRLFDDDTVLELDSDGLDLLAKVSGLDWSSIEPAIFGTLFERSLDPTKRSQLGAHYTSKDDILLIVEPVLMAPLRRRWASLQAQARELASRRDAIPDSLDRTLQRKRATLTDEISALIRGFDLELSQVRVLDPACGSGNFLYVALKQLLDLEKEVITFGGDLAVGTFSPNVTPEQLRGIELNEYAHELAQITVWIGYIQWLRDNGFGVPAEPILKPLDTIKHMDAILAIDDEGIPYEPAWPEADVIIGNPPFLGGKRLRTELGDKYVDMLFIPYKSRVQREADLVCYWFERARVLIEQSKIRRVGLLATNSIRQQQNRGVLNRIKETGGIFMAWSDRPWVLGGAAVRVSMVGFDTGEEQTRTLDDAPVQDINPDLTSDLDLTKAHRLRENLNIAYMGDTLLGPFDIDNETAQQMLRQKGNPNGRPNSDVVRPWYNGLDVSRRPRHMWVIDFGIDMSLEDASQYEMPFEYLQRVVKPVRDAARYEKERKFWWIHRRTAPDMRAALAKCQRYIATTIVAKHRLFVWINSEVLPDHKLFTFAREDDYFLGVLHSRVHELWSLATSSRHGDGDDGGRLAYSNTTTFETYPFPWPPGQEQQSDPRVEAIAVAARRLVELRDNWLNPPGADAAELKKRTLTNLYNQRPAWLDMAHKKLDAAVFAAYGWPADLTDEQILERLLALNLARAAAQGGAMAAADSETQDED